TEPFCERCDRLRVTSEGKLRSCLSEPDEIDLRDLLEQGAAPEELAREFGAAFERKPERHSASFSGAMRRIGG
ncbi:MAG: GTP 3',8-cyclase MoaA, partial [Planctomycetota bacterium]